MGAIATKQTIGEAGRQGVKGERTRQRIKGAFADLLERKSFASITIADICRTSDITVGGLYFHFPSQEELLDEVMAEYVAALASGLEAALEDEAFAEAVCAAFLEAYSRKIGLARTFQQLTRIRSDYAVRWRAASERSLQRLAQRLGAERADLAPDKSRFLAYALITMITSKLDQAYVYRDRSDAATGPSRAALSAELPELWRRMAAAGSP
ncbi:MAG TPA: TetR/AcrR family transcriptional regulator [Caulobacteraceae bacterium]|nr:TetR/AcrR family transcriptional regulator [Caulobacteraceae bacterium]